MVKKWNSVDIEMDKDKACIAILKKNGKEFV